MLPTTGPISIRDVATELKLTPTTLLSLNDARVRKLANKLTGSISMDDLHGKSDSLQVNVLHGANAAQYLVTNSDTADSCYSKGFYFTTDDDSEITFSDIARDYYNAIQPAASPISQFGDSTSLPGQRVAYDNKLYALTPNTTYNQNLAKYPLEYYQYTENSVARKTTTTYTYYPTGTVIEYNFGWFLLIIDNLSKANANVATGSGSIGGVSTFQIARIKADAAKVTDKLNVGAIVVFSSNLTNAQGTRPYGITLNRTKLKSASTGIQASEGIIVMDDSISGLFNARKP